MGREERKGRKEGKEGGRDGGNIVFSGTPEKLAGCDCSYTGLFLADELKA